MKACNIGTLFDSISTSWGVIIDVAKGLWCAVSISPQRNRKGWESVKRRIRFVLPGVPGVPEVKRAHHIIPS